MTASDDDFDWISNETIVVREQLAIAVYDNVYGHVTLRRERNSDEEEDCFISIAKENVLPVIAAMLRAAGMGDVELSRKLWDGPYGAAYEDVELPRIATNAANAEKAAPNKDRTAAERQRRRRAKRRDNDRDSDRDSRDGRDGDRDTVTDELPLRQMANE